MMRSAGSYRGRHDEVGRFIHGQWACRYDEVSRAHKGS